MDAAIEGADAPAGSPDDASGEDLSGALDPGVGRGRQGARRTCLVTREVKAPAGMLRFVLSPDGRVVPDLRARLPGRGAWITASRASVALAVKRRLFQRAFKTKAADPGTDLGERIAGGLRADLRQALALANKAGDVVTGFDKVEAAIGGRAGVAAVVHAAEASPDGRRKLAGALRRRYGDAISRIPIIDDLSSAELDVALGRDHVIHAALVAGAGATGCLARWRRLRTFEGPAVSEEDGPARAGAAALDPHDDGTMDRPGALRGAGSRDDGSPQGSD